MLYKSKKKLLKMPDMPVENLVFRLLLWLAGYTSEIENQYVAEGLLEESKQPEWTSEDDVCISYMQGRQ